MVELRPQVARGGALMWMSVEVTVHIYEREVAEHGPSCGFEGRPGADRDEGRLLGRRVRRLHGDAQRQAVKPAWCSPSRPTAPRSRRSRLKR